VLVGLPGAGKTTIGRAVAEKLGRQYLDFDAEIERRQAMTVADLFAMRGEPYFRHLEKTLTEEVATVPGGMVLTPGGGWIGVPGAVSLLRPPAIVIWLKVRPAEAMRRMGEAKAARPLLNRANPIQELERLLVERESSYQTADASINTEMFPMARTVERVILLAEEAAKKR
jgi:shikimate kinase